MSDEMNPAVRQALKLATKELRELLTRSQNLVQNLVQLIDSTTELGVTLEDVKPKGVTISWEAFTGATSYEASIEDSDESVVAVQEVGGNVLAFTWINVLTPSTPYIAVVLALDSDGDVLAGGSVAFDTPTATGPKLSLTTTATNDSVAVSWLPIPGATSYAVMRDGTDRDGFGSWASTTKNTSYRFGKLRPSTEYTVRVRAFSDTATLDSVAVKVSTKADPVVTPPPAAGKLAPFGRSGTGTNVIVFGPDTLTELEAWEKKYGVQVDGILTFVYRDNESTFLNDQFWSQCAQIAKTGRVVVISLPFAPVDAGQSMNQRVAKGDYDAFHKRLAAKILAAGLNLPNVVFRLAWEYNGNWYAWSTNREGGVEAFRGAWDNTVDSLRAAGVTRPLWDQTANKGPQADNPTTGADVFRPGRVDIVSVDHYNFWGPQNDDAGFARAVAQVPGLASQRALARDKGVQWAIPECGPANPASKDYGGDGLGYAVRMRGYVKTAKGAGDPPAYFTIYDDQGDPKELNHTLDANPNWRNELVSALRSGW